MQNWPKVRGINVWPAVWVGGGRSEVDLTQLEVVSWYVDSLSLKKLPQTRRDQLLFVSLHSCKCNMGLSIPEVPH